MHSDISKIRTPASLRNERDHFDAEGKVLVFTNGCFDLLHRGHLTYLMFARRQGDALAVGLNSDSSVRRQKGNQRPINSQKDRAFALASLQAVDYVVLFDEDEPRELIGLIRPHVIVKGRDWDQYVVGRDIVESDGGKVVLADMVAGYSTTALITRIVKTFKETHL